jgi:hypothetical protein
MATEVQIFCRRCRTFTPTPIDDVEPYRIKTRCAKCQAEVETRRDFQYEAIADDLTKPPTPELLAKYMTKHVPPRKRRKAGA